MSKRYQKKQKRIYGHKQQFHELLERAIEEKVFKDKAQAYRWLGGHFSKVNASKMGTHEVLEVVWNLRAKIETGHCLIHNPQDQLPTKGK